MHSKPVFKGHHTIRENVPYVTGVAVTKVSLCVRALNMDEIVHRSEKVTESQSVPSSHCPLNVADKFQ